MRTPTINDTTTIVKSLFLISVLLSQMLLLPKAAHASVTVTVGQPNIWSLEQAHYLLAQIRERNLGLRNKSLDESDLDPNAINATRLDAMRSLFEVGVSYDQGLGLTNKLNRQNLEFNQTRRQDLFGRRSALYDERGRLLGESGRLNSELSNLEKTEGNAEEIKQKEREIKAVQDLVTATDKQIENLNAELSVIGAGSTAISSPSPTAGAGAISGGLTDRIGKSITEDFAKSAAQNPRLTASNKLDNYIQMQYELLAKQLTLLRDEVSPNERLVFLELPTSVYATPGKGGDEMSVQSKWTIKGYYRDNKFAKLRTNLCPRVANLEAKLISDQTDTSDREKQLRLQKVHDIEAREIAEELIKSEQDFYIAKQEALEQGIDFPFATPDSTDVELRPIEKRGRVIDLIPRQSSLNVSDIKEIVKERGFKALFSLLIGIGGSVNYQQRRDHFEQFQQQEVYAAGFGKGSPQFGWNFNPAPGTKRLTPGIRTTYAVVVIPREATRIEVEASGTFYRTKDDPTSSTAATSYTLEIPNGPNSEGFFVTRIDYHKVKVNQPSVVILRGNFSNQTGILVNGVPLVRTVGLANPWLGSERNTPAAVLGVSDTSVKGYYEVINSNQLIMSFLMPTGFTGTPKITLISPNRARTLNDLRLNINGAGYATLDDDFRIGSKPDPAALTISNLQISPTFVPPGTLPRPAFLRTSVNLTLSGKKSATTRFYFNAIECKPAGSSCKITELAETLYNLELDLPFNLESVSFTVVQDKEVNTQQIDNPIFARAVASRITYDPANDEDGDDDTVTIVVDGKRIDDLTAVSDNANVEWHSQSFNQGVLFVSNLSQGQNIIRLTDGVTNASLAPIAIRKRAVKPKKPPKENSN